MSKFELTELYSCVKFTGMKIILYLVAVLIGCSSNNNFYKKDYYYKSSDTLPTIILIHGFSRDPENINELAKIFQKNGFNVYSPKIGIREFNDLDFTQDLSDWIVSQKDIKIQNGIILSGHSAGGKLAVKIASLIEKIKKGTVKGILLFDPVDRDNWMKNDFPKLNHIQIYGIFAEPHSCNAYGNSFPLFNTLNQNPSNIEYIRITGSSHCDAEGKNSTWVCHFICGKSNEDNKRLLLNKSLEYLGKFDKSNK